MNDSYITYEEFVERCRQGYTYDGYVIGYGLAFTHVTSTYEQFHPTVSRVPVGMIGTQFSSMFIENTHINQYIDTSDEKISESYSQICDDISKMIKKSANIDGKNVVIVKMDNNKYFVGDSSTKVKCKLNNEGIFEITVSSNTNRYTYNINKYNFNEFIRSRKETSPEDFIISNNIGTIESSISTYVSAHEYIMTSFLQYNLEKIFKDVTISNDKSPKIKVAWDDVKSNEYFPNNKKGKIYAKGRQQSLITEELNRYNGRVSTIKGLRHLGPVLNVAGVGFSVYGVVQYHNDPDASVLDGILSYTDLGVSVFVMVMPEFWPIGLLWLGGNLLCSEIKEEYYAAQGIDIRAEEEFDKYFEPYYDLLKRQYEEGGPRKFRRVPVPQSDQVQYGPNGLPVAIRESTRTTVDHFTYEPYNEPDYRLYMYSPDGKKTLLPLPDKQVFREMLRHPPRETQIGPKRY